MEEYERELHEHENRTPKIGYVFLAAVLLVAAMAFCVIKCKPEPTPAPPIETAEPERITKAQADSIRKSAYLERDKYWQPISKAQEREIIRLTSKDKQATEKARESAATFANSGKLEDCRTALNDCQEETATKAAVIASQAHRIDSARAQRLEDSTEIVASHKAGQDLNAGWQQANEANLVLQGENAKLVKKVKRRNRLLTIGGAVIAVFAGGVVAAR